MPSHVRTPLRTGSAKTFAMNIGPRALGASTAACRNSKHSRIRKLVGHIPVCKDGMTPTLLADDSAACACDPIRTQIPRVPPPT